MHKDGWNWQSFAKSLASAGYMPSNVTLTSLTITDGVLALHGPDGLERTQARGPQRRAVGAGARGAISLSRRIRLRRRRARDQARDRDTGEPTAPCAAAPCASRIAGSTYLLDARVADLMGKPRVEGDLTARVPMAGLWQPFAARQLRRRASRQRSRTSPRRRQERGGVRAEGGRQGRCRRCAASDLALTFEQDGRPQIVTGSMRADWRKDVAFDLTLASRWLDLDRITAAAGRLRPDRQHCQVRRATARPDAGAGRGQGDLPHRPGPSRPGDDRAVAAVADAVEREARDRGIARGPARRQPRRAAGLAVGTAGPVVFDGILGLRGTSVARFLAWASGDSLPIDPRGDGPFGLRARLLVGDGKVAAREICRQPVRHHARRHGALPVGGPARAGRCAGRPPDRRARIRSGRHQPGRHLRFSAARAAGQAGRRTRAHGRQSRAGVARSPTSCCASMPVSSTTAARVYRDAVAQWR